MSFARSSRAPDDHLARRGAARAAPLLLSCDHDDVSDNKVATMHDAIAELVRDGDTVAIEGFTHLICFAAGHEIIRQGRRDLTLCRLTPDLVYDQMVAAGVARKLVFSWLGNPGVGSLHAIRRATEGASPSLELEEYSHFGMVARYTAGAMNLPFFPAAVVYRHRPSNRQSPHPPDQFALRRRADLRGPSAQARRHDRARPARGRLRKHAGLGPSGLPEGGSVRS